MSRATPLFTTVVALALLLAGCKNDDHPGPPAVADPATTTPNTASSPPAPPPAVSMPAGPASTAACALISWADLPAALRSTSPPKPLPVDDPSGADCRLDHSDLGTITFSPTCPATVCDYTPAFRLFTVHLMLGKTLQVDPASYRGDPAATVTKITVAGADAVRVADHISSDGNDIPRCAVGWRTTTSKAQVIITNNRWPVDNCAIAVWLTYRLAPRIH